MNGEPRPSQRSAADVAKSHPYLYLIGKMGFGKTLTMLMAYAEMREYFMVSRMLVVAPKRVARMTWPIECAKFYPDLKIETFTGRSKAQRVKILENIASYDILTINPELLPWLFGKVENKAFRPAWWAVLDPTTRPDMLVVDEATLFKSLGGERAICLHKYATDFARRIVMTGTAIPNGIDDIFAQMMLVNRGEALGFTLGEYRDRYMKWDQRGRKHHMGKWIPKDDEHRDKIIQACTPWTYVASPCSADNFPDIQVNAIPIELPPSAMKMHRDIQVDRVCELSNGKRLMALEESAHTKLRQIAAGQVYVAEPGEEPFVYQVHDEKTTAFIELLEATQERFLVVYEHVCDLHAMIDAYRVYRKKPLYGWPQVLGGARENKEHLPGHALRDDTILNRWNGGKLDVMWLHPRSGGHGLNLQDGGRQLLWYKPPVDLEWWEQVNARLARPGQTSDTVFAHMLCARGTVDDVAVNMLTNKRLDQDFFTEALDVGLDAATLAKRNAKLKGLFG